MRHMKPIFQSCLSIGIDAVVSTLQGMTSEKYRAFKIERRLTFSSISGWIYHKCTISRKLLGYTIVIHNDYITYD